MNQLSFLDLLEDFFQGVIVTDSQGRVLFVNPVQAGIDDLPAHALVGKKVTEIYQVDEGESPTMQCLEAGRAIKGVACYYRTCTGKVINSIHNIFPLFVGSRIVGTLCFIQDFSTMEQGLEAVFQPGKRKSLQGPAAFPRGVKQGQKQSQREGQPLRNGTRFRFADIIGNSRQFSESLEAAGLSARSPSPVMLLGETGTGKELLAQSIHNSSSRRDNQYVAVNCAAIPENLLEAILFGTSQGAFTGAVDKEGLFERADQGTLFLDEINSMTKGLQAKLLRFLQERKVRRVGSLDEIDIDIKLISSVNQNPHTSIADGSLRSDLFYRLAVVFIQIPPLRHRLEDLELLIPHFLDKASALMRKKAGSVSREVMALFERYPWPGNVRELAHVIEGAMNLVQRGDTITLRHLPPHMDLFFKQRDKPGEKLRLPHSTGKIPGGLKKEAAQPLEPLEETEIFPSVLAEIPLGEKQKQTEIRLIRLALAKTAGRPSAAARILGISPQLLNYKLKRYGIIRQGYA